MGKFFGGIWNGIKGAAKGVYNFFRTSSVGKLALVGLLGVGLFFWGRGMAGSDHIIGKTLGVTAQVVGAGAAAGAVVETGARAVSGVAENPNTRRERYQALEEKRAREAEAITDASVDPIDIQPLQEAEALPRFQDQALGSNGQTAPAGTADLGAPLTDAELQEVDDAFQGAEPVAAGPKRLGLTHQLND